jgi:hypothetical protein
VRGLAAVDGELGAGDVGGPGRHRKTSAARSSGRPTCSPRPTPSPSRSRRSWRAAVGSEPHRPLRQHLQGLPERLAERSQLVLHADRHGRVNRPVDQAVAFEARRVWVSIFSLTPASPFRRWVKRHAPCLPSSPRTRTVLADADLSLSRGELFTDSGDLGRLIGRPTTPASRPSVPCSSDSITCAHPSKQSPGVAGVVSVTETGLAGDIRDVGVDRLGKCIPQVSLHPQQMSLKRINIRVST